MLIELVPTTVNAVLGMTSLNHVADAGSFAWLKPLPFSLFDLFGSGLLALNSLKLACAKEKD